MFGAGRRRDAESVAAVYVQTQYAQVIYERGKRLLNSRRDRCTSWRNRQPSFEISDVVVSQATSHSASAMTCCVLTVLSPELVAAALGPESAPNATGIVAALIARVAAMRAACRPTCRDTRQPMGASRQHPPAVRRLRPSAEDCIDEPCLSKFGACRGSPRSGRRCGPRFRIQEGCAVKT